MSSISFTSPSSLLSHQIAPSSHLLKKIRLCLLFLNFGISLDTEFCLAFISSTLVNILLLFFHLVLILHRWENLHVFCLMPFFTSSGFFSYTSNIKHLFFTPIPIFLYKKNSQSLILGTRVYPALPPYLTFRFSYMDNSSGSDSIIALANFHQPLALYKGLDYLLFPS